VIGELGLDGPGLDEGDPDVVLEQLLPWTFGDCADAPGASSNHASGRKPIALAMANIFS
jgi:hypothetical protein